MAEFNPEVPNTRVRDPEWTNVSRPISDISYDKSSAIAIGGATDILGSAVKAVDYDIKEQGKADVHAGVDPLRNAYIESLQAVRNVQIASADGSLLPATTAPDAPASLQNGIDRAKSIGTAMAQNGGSKVNDTLYTGALNSLAKTLRAQYPGYRDYIDEQIQSVSGINPANAFMKNLMEDINRNQEANKTEHNAALATLRTNADAGFHSGGVKASDVYGLVQKGIWTPTKGIDWLNSAKSVDYDRKTANDARSDRNANDADAAVSAQKDLSTNAAKSIAQDWKTMTMGKGTDTAEGLFKFLQANAGNDKVKDEQSQAIGQQLVQLRNASYAQRVAEATEGGKNSILAHLGGDTTKMNQTLDASYKTFDLAIDAVFHKDWGAAYSHMNFNKAIIADTTNTMYNAPDAEVAKYNRNVTVINQISPQFAKDFFTGFLTGDSVKKDVQWLQSQKLDMLVQPDAAGGQIHTLQEQLNNAKKVGATAPKTIQKLVTSIDDVSNPKIDPSQRLNLAKGFFDPTQNGQILSDKNFEKDRYDPTLKREIPGKYWVYRKMSSDNVATGIAELGKKDPSIIQDYRDTMTRNFGEQLFSRELRDVGSSNAENNGLYKIKFTDDKGRSPHFDILRADGSPMTMTEAIAVRAPVGATNRLNEGMSGLYNVYEKTGSSDPISDVKTAIFRYNYQDNTGGPAQGRKDESLSETAKAIWRSMISAQNERLKKVQGRQASPE